MSNDNDPYLGAFSQTPTTHAGPQQYAPPTPPPLPPAPPAPPVDQHETNGQTEVISREDIAQWLPGHGVNGGERQHDYQQHQQPAPETRDTSGGAHRPAPYTGGALVPARHTAAPSQGDQVLLDKTDVRRMTLPAEHGWRATLHKVTRINIGPGKDERYEISLKERTAKAVRQTFTVAVINLKGGVGKTVNAKLLGSTLSSIRDDKVIAVDLDNDSGNLTERHHRETNLSLLDLVADASVSRYLDVRAHTSGEMVSRLEVLGQPDFASSPRGLEPADFDRAMSLLQDYYSMVILDCGTALSSPLMQSALQDARAIVVVTNASIDALQDTDQTLEWLRYNGYHQLLKNLILVVNHTDSGRPNVVVDKVVEQFSRKIPRERIFVTPFDRHIHEGREINLKLVSKKTRRRALEIAAAVSDMFPKNVD